MCIVIDTNTFSPVFNSSDTHHVEFKPVKRWIIEGKGKIVYGGTEYRKQLRRAVKYFKLFIELKKEAKIVEIDDDAVDQAQKGVEKLINNPKFNDAHIIGIFITSKCLLLCSNDNKADKFIKDKSLYPRKHKLPKIYRDRKHKKLLCDKNIVALNNVV